MIKTDTQIKSKENKMEYQINLTNEEVDNYSNLDCQELADDIGMIADLLEDIDSSIFEDDMSVFDD
jgi:hypothetical protein